MEDSVENLDDREKDCKDVLEVDKIEPEKVGLDALAEKVEDIVVIDENKN